MEYYEKLRATREDLDITQEEIAKELKTTQAQIWKYEAGKQEMTVSKFKKLCLIYKVSADYILDLPKELNWPR